MACSSCDKKNRDRYQVVKNGKVLFQSSSQSTANAVSRRYDGSRVVQKEAAKSA